LADGGITAVDTGEAPGRPQADRVVDAGGKFVAPGSSPRTAIWADSRCAGLGTPGIARLGRARNQFLQYTSPEDLYWFVRTGCLDYIRSGVTTAYDFTNGGTITRP